MAARMAVQTSAACSAVAVRQAFKDLHIAVGAENLHYEPSGAYTGEVSADMLKDLGVKYVIIGHSERRQYFGETDISVNKKVHAALEAGLHPIICVGESLEQREMGVTMELIALQVKSALAGVAAEKVAGTFTAGTQMTTSHHLARGRMGRISSANFLVSVAVLFIFQLPAMIVLRYLRFMVVDLLSVLWYFDRFI